MVKKRSDTATCDNFESQLRNLPRLVSGFVTGDVRCLCEMAATLVAGHEYWVSSGREPILTVPGQAAIDQWYRTI